MVPVGAPILTIGTAGAVPAAPTAATPRAESAAPAGGEPSGRPCASGTACRDRAGRHRRRPQHPDALAARDAAAGGRSARRGRQARAPRLARGGTPRRGRPAAPASPVLAKPPVRKLARDLGVDLAAVDPTGADGVVTRADVERGSRGPAGGTHRQPQRGSGGARGADPGPRRAQHDGRGDGAQRLHRAARHRVPARRRHARRCAGATAPGRARVRRGPGVAAAARRQGAAARRAPAPDDQLPPGTRRPGRSWSSTT